jgi:hypothetical protein
MIHAPNQSSVWKLMDDAKRGLLPGMRVQCSLFGRVYPVRSHAGELVGEIPAWLQREARNHGFMVIGADWRGGKYTFEILP